MYSSVISCKHRFALQGLLASVRCSEEIDGWRRNAAPGAFTLEGGNGFRVGNKDRVIIESVWGLGEMIVQGSVVPDTYVVQKDTFAILSKEISDQATQLIKTGSGENKELEVPRKIRNIQKISDKEIVELAKLSVKLHTHDFFNQAVHGSQI